MAKHNLILASASQSRAQILQQAGLSFDICASQLDEKQIKDSFDGASEDLPLRLAEAKAGAVFHLKDKPTEDYILAADQILVCENVIYDKPKTMDEARRNLQNFRGKPHFLMNGLVLQKGETIIWQYKNHASLMMRAFSDGFLDDYLAAEGEAILSSVGAYRLEARGGQLFDEIKGDYFTILGLPLLPLLQVLRDFGVIPS